MVTVRADADLIHHDMRPLRRPSTEALLQPFQLDGRNPAVPETGNMQIGRARR